MPDFINTNRIIIFGAGGTGRWAFRYLGRNQIMCFADNAKAGTMFCRKEVISFDEMIEIYRGENKIVIVIAAESYWMEMEKEIKCENIERYFVFHEADLHEMMTVLPHYWVYHKPVYPSYAQILANFDFTAYRKIAVYGVNKYLPYLLLELMNRNPYADIKVIPQNEDISDYNTLGVEVKSLSFACMNADALVINIKQSQDMIRQKVSDMKEKRFAVIDLFDVEDFIPMFQHKELAVYKDIHKGKRIFVIGTGPSLRLEDLDTLHNNREICIACNKIYRIYDKTLWRADYYGFLDGKVIEDCKADIPNIPGKVFLGDSYHYEANEYFVGAAYFHYKGELFFPNYPRFSDDFTKGFYGGATTTYTFGIQLAAYLGASEIILLGVDNNVSGNVANPENHFIKDYFRDGEASKYKCIVFRKEEISKAYEGAEIYSKKHNFRIYNATRGGCLEAFERVEFDMLF